MTPDVRTSPWAPPARRSYANLADAMPLALETMLDDWQARVGRPDQVPFQPHQYLRVIDATRVELREGVWTHTDERKTYLVADGTLSRSMDTVLAHLTAHYPDTRWTISARLEQSVMVLDAGVE